MGTEGADPNRSAGPAAAIHRDDAGTAVVRGGALRAAGYLVGTGAVALAFALLLRHLGVAAFGRFSTVVAVVTVAAGLAEAGLTTVGQRRFVLAGSRDAQRRVLGVLVTLRLILTPIAVLLAVGFAAVAGYSEAMITGTAVAGLGGVLAVVAATVAIPLNAELRFVALTALEVVRQLVIVGVVIVLVAAGAGLGPFFLAYLVSGAAMLVLAWVFAGRRYRVRPMWVPGDLRSVLREVGPLAVALALNAFYLKLIIILASLVTSDTEVGLFAAASRVTEVIVGLPILMFGVAFPILAHAGYHDEQRLAYALQRLAESAVIAGSFFAVVLFVGAEPIIDVFAGPGYEDAIPVLRVQAFALIGASLTQVWILGVIAIERHRALVVVNLVALASVAVLGGALIPSFGAMGASVAAVVGETIMALVIVVALVRARPALRPAASGWWRFVVALVVPLGLLAVPVSPWITAPLAAALYVGLAVLLRIVPGEVVAAVARRGAPAPVQ
jgi:O-antigen/teichoic acid export membrane protein